MLPPPILLYDARMSRDLFLAGIGVITILCGLAFGGSALFSLFFGDGRVDAISVIVVLGMWAIFARAQAARSLPA